VSAESEQFDIARLAEIPDPLAMPGGQSSSSGASKGVAAKGEATDESSKTDTSAQRVAIRDVEKERDAVHRDAETVRAKILGEPKAATRREVRRRRFLAIGVSLLWFVALLFAAGFQRDVAAAGTAFLGQVVLPAALGFVAMYVAIARGRLGLGPRVEWLIGLTLAAPAVFAVAALASSAAPGAGDPPLLKHAIGCCSVAILVATVPMVAATYGLRRVSVTDAPWRSALVGIGIGLISAAVLGMHCSSTDGAHLVTGHITPVVLLGLSAVVVIRRFARAD